MPTPMPTNEKQQFPKYRRFMLILYAIFTIIVVLSTSLGVVRTLYNCYGDNAPPMPVSDVPEKN